MPSTSKKQHNFMAAIANNPSFAKKVGVPQSVGKDFTAADKGRKFGRGGRAAINKQDTKHGSMDMPFKSLKKHMGMEAGGKVKRYEEGGDVDSLSFGKAFRQKLNELGEGKTFTYKGKSYSTNMAKPSSSYRDEGRNRPQAPAEAKSIPSGTTNSGAVTGRTDRAAKNAPSDEQKERNAENLATVTQGIAALTPVGRGVRALGSVGKAATEAASASRAGRASARAAEEEIGVGASGGARALAARTQPPTTPPVNNILREAQNRIIREGRERNAFEQRARDTMRGEGGLKKGGSVDKHTEFRKGGSSMKESKAMMGKEVAFMKKKGAPASMIKHEKAEMGMKKFAKGGMTMRPTKAIGKDQKDMGGKLFAKGGGIESRGKTKGTIIRMASGGSVSARADGIAQRGKTQFKMC